MPFKVSDGPNIFRSLLTILEPYLYELPAVYNHQE